LALVREELSRSTLGRPRVRALVLEAVDLQTHEDELTLVHHGIRVRDAHAFRPQRLHLGSEQLDATFERCADVVVATSPAVLRNELERVPLGLALYGL